MLTMTMLPERIIAHIHYHAMGKGTAILPEHGRRKNFKINFNVLEHFVDFGLLGDFLVTFCVHIALVVDGVGPPSRLSGHRTIFGVQFGGFRQHFGVVLWPDLVTR